MTDIAKLWHEDYFVARRMSVRAKWPALGVALDALNPFEETPTVPAAVPGIDSEKPGKLPSKITVTVTVEFDYRMSETLRQQTQEALSHAILPLENDEAFEIKLKWSTNQ